MIQSQNIKRVVGGITLALIVWCSSAAVSETSWSGKCVGILDGDTILVMQGREKTKIRLYGIDCPEMGQDFGDKARQFTAKIAFGKMVTVQEMDWDQYGRLVAWVSADGRSLNKELLKAGLAWWYRYYAPWNAELNDLEATARTAKIGLWSLSSPIPPWEFRRESKPDW